MNAPEWFVEQYQSYRRPCPTCNDHGWTDQHGLRCFECGKSELDPITLAAIEVLRAAGSQ